MKIAQKYSHIYGEEYLLVHHRKLYREIAGAIESVDLHNPGARTKKGGAKSGKGLYDKKFLKEAFTAALRKLNWHESRFRYHVINDYRLIQKMIPLSFEAEKACLNREGIKNPLVSCKQIDFVKNHVAVQVQFGSYAFAAFDLFVKHLLFYSGNVINLGVEILPTRKMQSRMSSDIACYEGEVYNVMRHGRNNPPVPLLILGVE